MKTLSLGILNAHFCVDAEQRNLSEWKLLVNEPYSFCGSYHHVGGFCQG